VSEHREAHIIMAGGEDAVDGAIERLGQMLEDDAVRGMVICTLNNTGKMRLGVSVMSIALTPEEAINVLINAIEGLGMAREDLMRLLKL